MNYDVIKVEYIKEYTLKVYFQDGTSGEVDFKPVIDNALPYDILSDIELFKKVYIHPELKVLTWQPELDYDPLILYYKANKIKFPEEWGFVA